MLTFTTESDYVQTGTVRSHEVSNVSMSSGKCALPRIRRHSVAYVNKFNTHGSAEVVTEIRTIKGESKYQIRVGKRGIFGEPEVVFSKRVSAQGIFSHILEDMKVGNHRLYTNESAARTRDGKSLEFSDNVSLLLLGLERMTGKSFDSKFIDMGKKVGCRTSFPTLEKVVHGQAMRRVKVRRPPESQSFTSGMQTNSAGGAKLPSLKDQIGRNMMASKRNLEWAESALEQGNAQEAEYRFETACQYEAEAATSRSVLVERAALLRERVAKARAAKAAKKAAQSNANAA